MKESQAESKATRKPKPNIQPQLLGKVITKSVA